jgi:acyl-CoA reductase-like NAD-dependent aldehyde dehydrogenase
MNMIGRPEQLRQHLRRNILPTLDLRPFIDGDFRDPQPHEVLTIRDPYLMAPLVEMSMPSGNDADSAVIAAHRAHANGHWRLSRPHERADCLYKLATLIERDLQDLSVLETSDTGRTIAGVRGWEVPHAAEVYRYYARYAQRASRQKIPSTSATRIEVINEPVGVCTLLIPWNFPFACIAWKMAPALAAGCTVIVKSPERAPLSAQYLARLVQESGFPAGVVNIIAGTGREVGARLVRNPLVNKVSFTGSPATAREIVRASALHFPRLTLELGGKSPNLVFPDADVEKAAETAVDAIFGVAGQNCCSGSRTFVHASVIDEFMHILLKRTHARKLGDPMDEATEQGPQIDQVHLDRIASYVDDALGKGAECYVGGRPRAGTLFYEPTILGRVTDTMQLAREEVFGPVGAIYTFESEEEAFRRACDTEYSLAAGIWTADPERVERFLAFSHVGTCWVNAYNQVDVNAPWGGAGLSGYGRELGERGFEEYLQTRSVFW